MTKAEAIEMLTEGCLEAGRQSSALKRQFHQAGETTPGPLTLEASVWQSR